MTDRATMTTADTERLLRAHHQELARQQGRAVAAETDPPCPMLWDVACGTAPDASLLARQRARAHLSVCADCRGTVHALGDTDFESAPQSWLRRLTYVPQARAILAAAASVIVLATAVVLTAPSAKQQQSELLAKGPVNLRTSAPPAYEDRLQDKLHVAIRRGDAWLDPAAPAGEVFQVRTDDILHLSYSTVRAGTLAILSATPDGEVNTLWPSGGGDFSESVGPGLEQPLDAGGRVTTSANAECEWLVAVFAAEPLRLSELHETVAKAARAASGCELSVTIPNARSVRTVKLSR